MRRMTWLLVLTAMFIGCSSEYGDRDTGEKRRVTAQSIAKKLQIPWSINKKGDQFYISEREGTIVTVDEKTGKTSRMPVQLTKDLYTGGEGGLLGMELLPEQDGKAILYHTYQENGVVLNRVVAANMENGRWIETAILLEGIPGANIHNGGRVKIGPDRKLFITTGDAANPDSAQNKESLAGKILRVELDGSIPEDNPFAGSPVYSYGHRNPQGLAWDDDGQLFATEHGQSAHDEINRIMPGNNYGWPIIQGDEEKSGMETPIFHTNGNTWAPSGADYFEGKLVIASLRGTAVRTYDVSSGTIDTLVDDFGRIRDVLVDGNTLYFVTNNTDGRGDPGADDDQLIKMQLNKQ